MSEAIRIPADVTLSAEAVEALKAANPGVALVIFTKGTGTAAALTAASAEPHREAVSATVALVEGALHMGASLFVPPALGPLVNSILDAGVEAVDRLITGHPQIERWPLENIRALNAEIQGLEAPRT